MPRPDPAAVERRWHRLLEILEGNRHLLAKQGSLVQKAVNGHRYTFLRFCAPNESGKFVQRSVYVGSDPELILRVGSWLEELRSLAEAAGELRRQLRLARAMGYLARRGQGVPRTRGPRSVQG